MMEHGTNDIIKTYFTFIHNKKFPCVGAKAAMAKQQVKCMVAGHMGCPRDDRSILQFLYDFVDMYRPSEGIFYSAAVIFQEPVTLTENIFEEFLWTRLQALAILDAEKYSYDKRVSADPNSANFSFSLKEEAFFIIGLHPASSRDSRQFRFPTLVFNPHVQFEKLKQTNKYQALRNAARKRDMVYSGSVNPMLADFGKSSEAIQYSGRKHDDQWKCPLHINHRKDEHNPSA